MKVTELFENAPSTPADVLRLAGKLSNDAAGGNHPGVVDVGTEGGTFGGANDVLNMDSAGNVVLTRVAANMDALTKGWRQSNGVQDLLNTSEHHGGGNGLPTSGRKGWEKSFGSTISNRLVATFRIPAAKFLDLIRSGDAILGNLGEAEIVLNPAIARHYLTEINGKPVQQSTTKNSYQRAQDRDEEWALSHAKKSANIRESNMKVNELLESGGGAMPSRELLAYLKATGVHDDVINALIKAMNHSDVDPYAQSYAHAMTRALDQFGMSDGLYAIKTQVMYMLSNMSKWKGEEARECKKILKKWVSK